MVMATTSSVKKIPLFGTHVCLVISNKGLDNILQLCCVKNDLADLNAKFFFGEDRTKKYGS